HANGAIAAGCHHSGCQGKDWHALRDAVEPGWRDRRGSTPFSTGARNNRQQGAKEGVLSFASAKLVRLSDVTPQAVRWLWPGRIALGKLTLIAGEPGLGKSFLTMDIATRVSR